MRICTGVVGVARTRSRVCQARSVSMPPLMMDRPSIEKRISMPVTAWAAPPVPRAAVERGCSAVISTSGIAMRLSTGPGSRASSAKLCRMRTTLRMGHRQGMVEVVEGGVTDVDRCWPDALREKPSQVCGRVNGSDLFDSTVRIGQFQMTGQVRQKRFLATAGDDPAGGADREAGSELDEFGQVMRGVTHGGTLGRGTRDEVEQRLAGIRISADG